MQILTRIINSMFPGEKLSISEIEYRYLKQKPSRTEKDFDRIRQLEKEINRVNKIG